MNQTKNSNYPQGDGLYVGTNTDAAYNQSIAGLHVSNYKPNIIEKLYTVQKLSGIKHQTWGEMLGLQTGKDAIYTYLGSVYDAIITKANGKMVYFEDDDGNRIDGSDRAKSLDYLFVKFVGENINSDTDTATADHKYSVLNAYFDLVRIYFDPLNATEMAITALTPSIQIIGSQLKQDYVPSIDRAAFIQVRQKVGDNLGLTAWYLRSMGDGYHKTGMYGTGTDLSNWSTYNQEMDIANVFGLGAQYRMGA